MSTDTTTPTAPPATPKLGLDLDALEREGEVAGPFTFRHDGVVYTMLDPQEIDWQDLLSGLRNPALFVKFAMGPEDQKKFFGSRVPAWKMNQLMKGYQDWFGLPDLGNLNALRG
jgi:hypothetical protein